MSLLQGSFPKALEADWRPLAQRALKGKPLESLVARSEDGLAIGPIYPQRFSAEPLASRPGGRRWRVIERIDHPDPRIAHALAAEALENGANGLELVFETSPNARGAGLSADGNALPELLDGLPLAKAWLRFDGGGDSQRLAVASRALDVGYAVVFDPLATLAGQGRLPEALSAAYGAALAVLDRHPALVADTRPYHAAGATEAQELGIAAATLIAHWRGLEAAGGALDKVAGKVAVTLVAEADELMTIAKLRAMRRIHGRLLQASGLPVTALALHAETAWRMLTRRDPYTNMLRSGAAAFGAAVGGADSIIVLPFTARMGLADGFAARQARNTQLLLAEESNLHRVHDPAAGAGAVEKVTEELAAAAWRRMQAIEAEGGILAALQGGSLQRLLAGAAAERAARLASGAQKLIGVNLAQQATPPALSVTPFPDRARSEGGKAAETVAALQPAAFEDGAEAGREGT